MNEADKLREIADKLFIWRKSIPEDKKNPGSWIATRLSKEVKEAARESLMLLVEHDNIDLLYRCSRSYGDNNECRNALYHIDENVLVGMRNRPLDSFVGEGYLIALPGFISELRRWADNKKQ